MAALLPFRPALPEDAPLVPYYLTDRETRRHGVDIGEALTAGLVSPEDFRAVLRACRRCRDGEALHEGALHDRCAPAAPDSCANRALLEGLRGIV